MQATSLLSTTLLSLVDNGVRLTPTAKGEAVLIELPEGHHPDDINSALSQLRHQGSIYDYSAAIEIPGHDRPTSFYCVVRPTDSLRAPECDISK
jgi:hypothetical protein